MFAQNIDCGYMLEPPRQVNKYDVAVFQWITSCNKSVMITCVLTLLREYITSLTMSIATMYIFIENMTTLKSKNLILKGI